MAMSALLGNNILLYGVTIYRYGATTCTISEAISNYWRYRVMRRLTPSTIELPIITHHGVILYFNLFITVPWHGSRELSCKDNFGSLILYRYIDFIMHFYYTCYIFWIKIIGAFTDTCNYVYTSIYFFF